MISALLFVKYKYVIVTVIVYIIVNNVYGLLCVSKVMSTQ